MAEPQLSPDQIKSKLEEIQKRHARVLKLKAEKSGELKARREELALLLKEIKEAGYDPKELVKERDKVQGELEAMLKEVDEKIVEVEKSLSAYDKK
jgi:uncharacterized protein YceH (UPF0502 family)